jgi:hypothetical protein
MKIIIYQHDWRYSIGAGGGIRTLTLFRAPAPKAGAYAVSPRPRSAIVPFQPGDE